MKSWRAKIACLLLIAATPGLFAQEEVESDPGFLAGRAALDDGFYSVAARNFETYVASAASPRMQAFGVIFLFNAWHGEGKHQSIIDWMQTNRTGVIEGTPYEAPAVYWLARALYATGNYEAALRELNSFEERYPDAEFASHALRLRAETLRSLGNYDRAEKLFARYHREYPERSDIPDNLMDWADTFIRLERLDKAREKVNLVVTEHAEHPAAYRARLWLGQWAVDEGQSAAVTNWLSPLVADEAAPPDIRADAWFILARQAVEQQKTKEALAALERGEKLTTRPARKVEARIDRARLLMNDGQLDDAMKVLNTTELTQGSMSEAARVRLELADLLRAREEFSLAADAYQRYIESFSDSAGLRHALYSRAWCLWELKRYAEAALAFEKAYNDLRNDVLREQALIKAADAYFMNSQYKLAATAYERVMREFPDSRTHYLTLYQAGESYARSSDAANAVRILRGLAENEDAGDAMIRAGLFRLARFFEEQRAWAPAIESYDEFIARFPGHEQTPEALLERGLLRYRLGNYAGAREDFARILGDHPGTTAVEQAFFMQAWCAYQLGDTTNALSTARQFIATYTNSVWLPNVRFWLAEHAFNTRLYDQAETEFASLAGAFPTNELADDALYWAGRAAFEQKAFRRALDNYLNPLIRQYPQSPRLTDTHFTQGDALTEIGDFAGAILAFREINMNHPDSVLAPRALGRIGDCQFTLGAERPERYAEALESFRAAMNHPRADEDLALQAEFKLARTLERLARNDEALEQYLNVVYGWLTARSEGKLVDERWFVRSAFNAAALREAAGAKDEALAIYRRVVESGITAAADANIRIDRLLEQRQNTIQRAPLPAP